MKHYILSKISILPNGEKIRLSLKDWILLILLEIILSVIIFDFFKDVVLIIKYFIYVQILLYTSYVDSKTKIIPNEIHILIFLLGIINIDFYSSVLNLFVLSLPFFIAAYITGGIGGGDIKFMASNGFFIGFKGIETFKFITGSLLLALLINFIVLIINKKAFKKQIALAPYLSIGCFLSCLI
ncbi:prepilin peptidase [Clostridioides sp. ES-S-0108-01]|uniref:prepilin peptidase n=1 Tax=unclassified Clostridioides TaxID=2635829 RepID=UPI001C1D8421|nr:prepilin peptidase [Clostridioides sp. ES-S-0107-01]MCC0784480.1 prepilin peptidase [Clostridioides sp. ES-S-0108-01]UDN53100.1 prepilin peptidase [Clostridioides sp. ES-S-0107-01]HBG2405058.1 prepilin peptidase [Clostridioides difficile]